MTDRNLPSEPHEGSRAAGPAGAGAAAAKAISSSSDSSSDAQTLVDFDATLVDAGPRRRSSSGFGFSSPELQPGTVLGGRYEILQLLGEGGMGAVYKAMDRELGRPVALKLIRPELAANPAILARFKQELLLAHQVTHKNVIRIYDLGDADGVKFITMEFVDGVDLRALILEHKKFRPEEAVEIMLQVCRALEAAHSVGVIHRDLKPQNVMRDHAGRILVMDFGLARTLEGDGMTQTGALVGTMEYMSPEQALAKDLDQRSDIFAVGLILYELLTGSTPYRADSALASLIKRTQERAVPVSDHDGTIPRALSEIVSKCLERDPAQRYQKVGDMTRDLEAFQGKRAAATLGFEPNVKPWGQTVNWPVVMSVMAAVVLALLTYIFRGVLFSPASSTKTAATAPAGVTLAVLPFQNKSGDASWDWLGQSLADMLSTDVGQSAQLRTVSPDRVQQVLHDLRISPASSIDEVTLKRVAEFSNADTLVWGQFTKLGDQVRIDATIQDRKHSRTVQVKAEAASQNDLSAAVDRLAAQIRQNLALAPDSMKELQAQSFKPASTSVEALRDYDQGLQLLRQGNNLEAKKQFDEAIKADANFADAYSRLGEAYSALGYDTEAEQASRRAVDLGQNLPQAQRLFLEASLARVTKDNQKAIAAYENLAKSFPDNLDVQFALGTLYEDAGDFDKARTHYEKVLQADGNNVDALLAMGRVDIKSGDPQKGLDPLDRARHIAIDVNNQEQQALILQATGIAYKLMNKPDEALRNYEDAMAMNEKLGQKRGVAASLVEIAQVQLSLGKPDAAAAAYNQALKIRQDIGAKKEAGDTLIDLGDLYAERGQPDKALEMFKQSLQIQRDANDETYQALCLNNIGTAYFQKGDNENALTYLQQALTIRQKLAVPADIAETLHNLGAAYANLGQYDDAMTAYMNGLELYHTSGNQQGTAVMSQAVGIVFQNQGRLGPAVSALQDAVKTYRDLGDRSVAMGQALNDLADVLAKAGAGTESAKPLEEAQELARGLKNDVLQAAILNTQGDVAYYQGDLSAAENSYQQALRLASKTSDKDVPLIAKLDLAKVAIAQGRAQATVSTLRSLGQQADALGRKYIAVDCSLALADALIKTNKIADAQQELQRTLGKSEKLGLRLQNAKIHYLMGMALQASGKSAEAGAQFKEAQRLLDDIRKEPGAEHIPDRYDLKPILSAAAH